MTTLPFKKHFKLIIFDVAIPIYDVELLVYSYLCVYHWLFDVVIYEEVQRYEAKYWSRLDLEPT